MSTAVIVGLGNPGARYAGTRHNVGFVCVDEVAHRYRASFTGLRCRSSTADVHVHGRRVILAKPRTYVNLAGTAVQCFVRKEGLSVENLVVIYDDMDLPVGKVRIRSGGSHGGHNGMRSIIESLGTPGFPRIRVGIGRPGDSAAQSEISYVLGRFRREEEDVVGQAIELVSDAVDCILSDGLNIAMNRFN
ncbi:MAG: aminoacyl-tRNA hydrolase [Chloroflexota bacterium]